MPFKVKIGGQVHEARQWIDPERAELERNDDEGHQLLLIWESYCDMGYYRSRAIAMWDQARAFSAQVDEKGVDHPKRGAALTRLWVLEDAVQELQANFIIAEQRAGDEWERFIEEGRDRTVPAKWLGVDPNAPSIYPMWMAPMGNCAKPVFGMGRVPLLIATPKQAKAYVKYHLTGGLTPIAKG